MARLLCLSLSRLHVTILLLFTFFWLLTSCRGEFTSQHFHTGSISDIKLRLNKGCSKQIDSVPRRNSLKCVGECVNDERCMGASLDDSGTCFHHDHCVFLLGSPSSDDRHLNYWGKRCVHGTWDSVSRTCQCDYLSFGERCEKCVKDCRDLSYLDSSDAAEYKTCLDPDPLLATQVIVICRVVPGSDFRIKVAQNFGQLGFDRSWEDYAHGFEDEQMNYWIGLETWHVISSFTAMTLLNVQMKSDVQDLDCTYMDFEVKWAAADYRFTYDTVNIICKNPIVDCFENLQNVPFSTFDRDSDGEVSRNCASESGSGWWYDECNPAPCNLFGGGFQSRDSMSPARVFSWNGLGDTWYGWGLNTVLVEIIVWG